MTEIEKKPSASQASPFMMTPEQHRAVAAKVRAFPGEPEAQRCEVLQCGSEPGAPDDGVEVHLVAVVQASAVLVSMICVR